MLKEVDKNVWIKEIASQETTIFDNPEYLETISLLYHTTIKYWIVYKRQKVIIGFATHIKKQSIIVPDHYSYSSFWYAEKSIGDFSFFEYLQQAISVLKNQYRFIQFRLPPHIKDIRAFNYHNFSSRTTYTYINKLEKPLKYRSNIEAKLKQARNQGFTFFYDCFYEAVLKQQLNDFKYFGYTESKEYFFRKYFKTLIDKGFLKSYTVYKNEELISSALVLLYESSGKAYNLLLSSSKSNYSGEASSFLYHHIFLHLKEMGFEYLDLYGADMKGIANYKSGFKGDLENHFTVNFGFSNRYVQPMIFQAKRFIKRFL